ncbi:MAG TPA: ATP-binding protein [Acidimicrobiales bacterium]|nr:ATP-binding protein [Acidimicrobiales bacterium]
MPDGGATAHFDPDPKCVSSARRLVGVSLDEWGLTRLCDEAVLCTSEMATNSVLHARTAFTLALRPIPGGLRIDVQDDRPDRLPLTLPDQLEPLSSGTTGRGLRLIAGVATRWGYYTTDLAKTVWVELTDARPTEPVDPLVELAVRPPDRDAPQFVFVDVPVSAAVASGFQVDDLVRELQLSPERLSEEEQKLFVSLLEASAPLRLMGRQEALRAAGQGRDRFTLELAVSAEEMEAVRLLTEFLGQLATGSRLEAGRVDPEVTAMRAWLFEEAVAQHHGRAPTPFRFAPA